jgi:hypothetical protein
MARSHRRPPTLSEFKTPSLVALNARKRFVINCTAHATYRNLADGIDKVTGPDQEESLAPHRTVASEVSVGQNTAEIRATYAEPGYWLRDADQLPTYKRSNIGEGDVVDGCAEFRRLRLPAWQLQSLSSVLGPLS